MEKHIPDAVELALHRAIAAGEYLVAVIRIENGCLHLDRTTSNFPHEAFKAASQLITQDLLQEFREAAGAP